ncbi:MAG: hypothetical protein EHM64_09580 [Ignavibacteriae bacterium]|nr:MAG: hypothetical protein EHM64_09580 [Ignavibacteriota bacterium]
MNLLLCTARFFITIFLLIVISSGASFSQYGSAQDDTVIAYSMSRPPVIDGRGDESSWQEMPWQPIAQVWLPYGTPCDSSDFSGRYKVGWSATTNLLYFLVEVTDNIFVDGFIPGTTAEVYNYDIVEVFIDEDKSGGPHVFDAVDRSSIDMGKNAENAFAYHIYAPFPKKGSVTTEHFAGDIAGSSWTNIRRVNYGAHIPEFALRRSGTKAVWEFSLIVYHDTYIDTLKNNDAARSLLKPGKVMGLSLAYCDNDHPGKEPKVREKFYGSVRVPAAAWNEHWKNADYFGTVKLIFIPINQIDKKH